MDNGQAQKTIKNEISIKGIGLHTGKKCKATFKPAPANSGIQFVRVDLPEQPVFKANLDNVIDVIRGTTLGSGESRVYTIEHILSALCGFQIDNLRIELDESEPPVGDGSSSLFVDAIKSVGIEELSAPRKFFKIETPIEYKSNQTLIRVEPYDTLKIDCEIDYNHPMLKNQKFTFSLNDDYEKEISPARTYCFDYEIEALKKQGLAKGGSLDNAIVIGPAGIYNPGSFLRFDNEFVRHKILDLMGDLTLLGHPLKGHVTAKRCGHGHNVKFMRQILERHPIGVS